MLMLLWPHYKFCVDFMEVWSAALFLPSMVCAESNHVHIIGQPNSGSYTPSLCFRAASEGALKGILGYTDEDVVSNDFVGDSRWLLQPSDVTKFCPVGQKVYSWNHYHCLCISGQASLMPRLVLGWARPSWSLCLGMTMSGATGETSTYFIGSFIEGKPS